MSEPKMSLMDLIKSKKAALNQGKMQKTLKPADGRNKYRILPSWRNKDFKADGDPTFYHDFGQHFIKDESDTIKAIYMCTDKTYGKPCAVCDAIEQGIRASRDDSMVELLKKSKSTGRILLNVLHIDGPTPNDPQILELAPTAFNEVLNIFGEWGDISDLEKGKDIIVEKTGKGIGTRYSVQPASTGGILSKSIMSKVANLDEYVAQESEEVKARAVNSVKSILGLLSYAGEAPVAKSRLAAPSVMMADDTEFEDVTYISETPKGEVVPKPVAKKAAPVVADDDELNSLLASLDD